MAPSITRQDATIWQSSAYFGGEQRKGQSRRAGSMVRYEQRSFSSGRGDVEMVRDGFICALVLQIEFLVKVVVPW